MFTISPQICAGEYEVREQPKATTNFKVNERIICICLGSYLNYKVSFKFDSVSQDPAITKETLLQIPPFIFLE